MGKCPSPCYRRVEAESMAEIGALLPYGLLGLLTWDRAEMAVRVEHPSGSNLLRGDCGVKLQLSISGVIVACTSKWLCAI